MSELQDMFVYFGQLKDRVRRVIDPSTAQIYDNGLKANVDYVRKASVNIIELRKFLNENATKYEIDFKEAIRLIEEIYRDINALMDNNFVNYKVNAWGSKTVTEQINEKMYEVDLKLNREYIEHTKKKNDEAKKAHEDQPFGLRRKTESASSVGLI